MMRSSSRRAGRQRRAPRGRRPPRRRPRTGESSWTALLYPVYPEPGRPSASGACQCGDLVVRELKVHRGNELRKLPRSYERWRAAPQSSHPRAATPGPWPPWSCGGRPPPAAAPRARALLGRRDTCLPRLPAGCPPWRRAVLAGQEAAGQREVRQARRGPARAHTSAQFALVLVSMRRGCSAAGGRRSEAKPFALDTAKRLRKTRRRVVRRGDVPHLAVAHELVERAKRLLERRVGVVAVRVVEVDAVAAAAAAAIRRRLRGSWPAPGPSASGACRPWLRRPYAVRLPRLRHPAADDRLRFAADVAGNPRGVGVGRVDEVAARRRVGVEHGERLRPRRRSSRRRCRRGRGETRQGRSSRSGGWAWAPGYIWPARQSGPASLRAA